MKKKKPSKEISREMIGSSFKGLNFEQQKRLLLNEVRESRKGVGKGAPFGHLLRCSYDDEVIKDVILLLSENLGQKGQYFPGEPPTQIAWIEFAGTPL